jgi:hypothetical protein
MVTTEPNENSTSNTIMKQSPSSGALNELDASTNDGTSTTSPICLKSRRTAFNIEHQQSESSNTTSAHTSSNTLSSLQSEYSDFSHGKDDLPAHEFLHSIETPLRNHEADILEAVNMLRVDSQKSLHQLCYQGPSEVTENKVMTETGTNGKCNISGLVENHSDGTQKFVYKNPVSLYMSLLKANDNEESSNASAIIPGSSLSKDYFHQHTQEEIAGYEQSGIVSATRKEDLTALRKLLKEGHPIQCSNRFGESIVHMACRHGSIPVLLFLLEEAKVSLRVIDDMGRTPFHDACWGSEPRLEMMKILLKKDPFLLRLSDKRGHIALDYVNRDHWSIWCRFLNEHQHLLVAK